MIPEKVPRTLYIYSLKMRSLLLEKIEQLERELRGREDEFTGTLQQLRREIACLKTERDRARAWAAKWKAAAKLRRRARSKRDSSASLAVSNFSIEPGWLNEAVPRQELELILQSGLGRSLLAWREGVIKARQQFERAEKAFAALGDTTSEPVRAYLYGELQEAGDLLIEAVDVPLFPREDRCQTVTQMREL